VLIINTTTSNILDTNYNVQPIKTTTRDQLCWSR